MSSTFLEPSHRLASEGKDEYISFEHIVTIEGLKEPATALAMSPDGRFVVAAGEPLCLNHKYRSLIDISTHANRDVYSLVIGTFHGEVHLWHMKGECVEAITVSPPIKLQAEVTDIAISKALLSKDAHSTLVAVACSDGTITILKLRSKGFDADAMFSVKLDDPNFLPKSVSFANPQLPSTTDFDFRDLVVFAYQGGGMASIAMLQSGSHFVAHTGSRYELISLVDGKAIRAFASGPCLTLLAKRPLLSQQDSVFVGGTDEGRALVFDLATGKCLQELECRDGPIQLTSTCTFLDSHWLALAGGCPAGGSQIVVYKANRQPVIEPAISPEKSPKRDIWWLFSVASTIALVLVVGYRGWKGHPDLLDQNMGETKARWSASEKIPLAGDLNGVLSTSDDEARAVGHNEIWSASNEVSQAGTPHDIRVPDDDEPHADGFDQLWNTDDEVSSTGISAETSAPNDDEPYAVEDIWAAGGESSHVVKLDEMRSAGNEVSHAGDLKEVTSASNDLSSTSDISNLAVCRNAPHAQETYCTANHDSIHAYENDYN
ncbi:uncharacterized protein SCHCODRAFT_02664037 [Schizophyllum commune H4-8]|uniref:WD40 repeat-like protein n=1 Tax=Schizophyllum commune (strain H4-8 / FGSC 9210) TaxID=578458 RepID=D8PZ21_SCHCM|nr:uncharacterized protein SCHCODRAFT_02664037 [Schizophyllum commune H4-8]KAI5896193.1 hypothetical protein SCHCODRAFT_02664037 [Schizophyllum commune H4-8]